MVKMGAIRNTIHALSTNFIIFHNSISLDLNIIICTAGNLSIHSTGSAAGDISYLPGANGSTTALGKRPPHGATFVGVQSK